eukprot:TRINITY_DN796_c0_g3_i2.p1 TRINITY_DN796_c0_g3~~TRINITY_DN796_c0_g3_i2.p1  ORF type:complete len:275 (+),score=57.85 TRINITY_DN796_c0_g3_i2:32-826(+)
MAPNAHKTHKQNKQTKTQQTKTHKTHTHTQILMHTHTYTLTLAHTCMRKTHVQAAPRLGRVALIAGDGVGRELIAAATRVITAVAEVPPAFAELPAGYAVFKSTGNSLPRSTVEALRTCSGALFGAVNSPSTGKETGYTSPIVLLRQQLSLFANVRPIQTAGIDLVVIRENTEDVFVQKERLEQSGALAVAERHISVAATSRVAHFAFQHARQRYQLRLENSRVCLYLWLCLLACWSEQCTDGCRNWRCLRDSGHLGLLCVGLW